MLASTTSLTLFAALAAAIPTPNLFHRAGGPSITPIPSNCTISNPRSTEATTSAFLPTPDTSSVSLYSAYYPSEVSNTTQLAEQCLEQCYGYGDHTECKAAFWAENVKTPPGYYGSPGGDLMTACLLYNRTLTDSDFENAPEGEGTDAYTRNLACPGPATR